MRRNTKTKEKLVVALVYLLETKSIESITVMDVVKQSGVGRGTFYLVYFQFC